MKRQTRYTTSENLSGRRLIGISRRPAQHDPNEKTETGDDVPMYVNI